MAVPEWAKHFVSKVPQPRRSRFDLHGQRSRVLWATLPLLMKASSWLGKLGNLEACECSHCPWQGLMALDAYQCCILGQFLRLGM